MISLPTPGGQGYEEQGVPYIIDRKHGTKLVMFCGREHDSYKCIIHTYFAYRFPYFARCHTEKYTRIVEDYL